MSHADREKWNERYRGQDCACIGEPNRLLVEWLPNLELPPSPSARLAVDVACGTGRHALYLARHGWRVDAFDISDVGLERLAAAAQREALPITCRQADFEPPGPLADSPFEAECYDLAVMMRYTNLALMAHIARALRPGGYLVTEVYLKSDVPDAGPRNPDYRVSAVALREVASPLEIVAFRESMARDSRGQPATVAQLVARRRHAVPAVE